MLESKPLHSPSDIFGFSRNPNYAILRAQADTNKATFFIKKNVLGRL